MRFSHRSSGLPADWLKQRAVTVRGLLRRSLAANALSSVALCVQAWLLAQMLYTASFQQRPWRSLLPSAFAFAVLALARWGLSMASRHYGFRAGRQQVAEVRATLLAHSQQLGPAWLARESSGVWVTRLVDGAGALEAYYARYLPQMASAAVLPIVVLAAVFPADWVAATVLLLTAPLVPIFMILLGNAAERASQRRWTVLTRLGAQFNDLLQGLVTLRLFGAGERAGQLLEIGSETYRRGTMAVLRVAFLSSLVLEFFSTVSIAVVAVLTGFRLLWGEQVFSHAMFVLLLAPEFYLPLRGLGALRHVKMDALAIARDARMLLETPVEPQAHEAHQVSTAASAATIARDVEHTERSTTLPPDTASRVARAVTLQQVSFRYPDGRAGLHDLNIEFAAGETTAVIGPSGAGKSTLLQLVLGLQWPQHGTLLMDDVALDDDTSRWWREQLAWLPQRPRLFAGTLRDNLLIASPGANQAALVRAASQAGLSAVIAGLPRGWDTPLGEHGYGLSGGEAQRVALARALLRDAPVLVLDEPMQQLDEASIAIIDEALEQIATEGRTIIQVGHRMAQARRADRVVVLDDGRLVQQGPPATLERVDGLYAALLAADGLV